MSCSRRGFLAAVVSSPFAFFCPPAIGSPAEPSSALAPQLRSPTRVPPAWGQWSEQQLEQIVEVCRQDAWATSRRHCTSEVERAAWWASFFSTAWSTGARHGELRANFAFWRESELVFPWNGHRATFCKHYRQILAAAGFPVANRVRRAEPRQQWKEGGQA